MSTIAGLYQWDGGPASRSRLAPMLDTLAACGGEARCWAPETESHPVALGCRPLRITAEDENYHPPLRSPDGQLVLVADARIDNRVDLGHRLGISAAEAGTLSDPGFILAAYEAWGRDCVRHLLGDFVFLLWDGQRRTLFGARDGLGQRVLFFHRSPSRVAFASTPAALLALDDVPARLNRRKVAMALVLLQDPGTTYFEGIERLLPGHTLEAGPSGIHIAPFWTPVPTREIRFASDSEYVEAFLGVFDSAVRARTRGTGGIGVLLSGGIDSTAVAATAALTMEGRPLHAFHAAPALNFDGRIGRGMVADESADVVAIAEHHPTIDLRIDRASYLKELWEVDSLYGAVGSPVRNPSNWGWYQGQYAAARAVGVRVMLNGSMGNATISHLGTRSLRDLARRGAWATLWREMHSVAAATGAGRWSVLRDQVLLPLIPLPVERLYRRWRGLRTLSLLDQSASALRRDQVAAFALEDVARTMGRGADQLRRCRGLDLRLATLAGTGETFDALNGLRAWHGIETRDPTADTRVVEFCLAIPETQYHRGGEKRWLIRRAMRGRVPDQVLDRKEFGGQGADWMDWMHFLRPDAARELDNMDRSETARDLLDLPRLRTLLDRWPERFGPEHEVDYKLRFLRGIMMGRFLLWFERTHG